MVCTAALKKVRMCQKFMSNFSAMDVSADLTELGRTDICVVSAGVKSILDIGRTLEFLETQGVTVIGFGTG